MIAEDPDDNVLLASEREGNAASIIAGDGRLLSPGANERIKMVAPVQFLGALAQHQDSPQVGEPPQAPEECVTPTPRPPLPLG